jgi:FKBP-type peptidyl-prolyl cis-trans isomerase
MINMRPIPAPSTNTSFVLGILVAVVMTATSNAYNLGTSEPSRRTFLQRAASSAVAALVGVGSSTMLPSTGPLPVQAAAPQIFDTANGIKYAVLIPPKDKSAPPAKGDLVAIEYTGYLTDGTVFDSTHAEGKRNALLFQLGGNAVIDGINEM